MESLSADEQWRWLRLSVSFSLSGMFESVPNLSGLLSIPVNNSIFCFILRYIIQKIKSTFVTEEGSMDHNI